MSPGPFLKLSFCWANTSSGLGCCQKDLSAMTVLHLAPIEFDVHGAREMLLLAELIIDHKYARIGDGQHVILFQLAVELPN
jgi:hypothetical protein